MDCEYLAKCKTCDAVGLKKQCLKYRQIYVYNVCKQLPPGQPAGIKDTKPLIKPQCLVSVNPQRLKSFIIRLLEQDLKSFKLLSYNTAVQVALSDELPSEAIIYIDAAPNYPDISKGMQVIESLVDACIESGKYVFMHVKPQYRSQVYHHVK